MNPIVRLPDLDRQTPSADFRAAMRQLAGGVSVITAGAGTDISGMTVTSVSSLSVDSPSLIVSINRASSSWPLLQRHRFFGVNILSADQIDVAERFTGKDGLKGADRFVGTQWTVRDSGVRLLAGALAAIECEAEDIIERHSHAIVIGRVLHVQLSPGHGALAYWQGDYVAIDREEDMVKLADVSVPGGHAHEMQAVSYLRRQFVPERFPKPNP
jgi:flavin reductase (DIM6/NTAB) family NADH-FMN oxidoreductase RutF